MSRGLGDHRQAGDALEVLGVVRDQFQTVLQGRSGQPAVSHRYQPLAALQPDGGPAPAQGIGGGQHRVAAERHGKSGEEARPHLRRTTSSYSSATVMKEMN